VQEKDFFIVGLLLVLGLVHPFHDGNGRTMRLLLCKTLLELKRLPNSAAVAYTTFRNTTNSAYSSAWYEIRVNEDFGPYLQMFR
jgi:Fic family protein